MLAPRFLPLVLAPLFFVLGCGQGRQARPVADDEGSIDILVTHPWQQTRYAVFVARLQVQGPDESSPVSLDLVDVPYHVVPTATLTFFDGDKELACFKDVNMKRDC